MKLTKILITTAVLATGLFLSACTSSSLPPLSGGSAYIHKGVNFGSGRDASFKHGVRDGCRTSDGDYTKNHTLFNNNESYKVGWEDGRLQCKGK